MKKILFGLVIMSMLTGVSWASGLYYNAQNGDTITPTMITAPWNASGLLNSTNVTGTSGDFNIGGNLTVTGIISGALSVSGDIKTVAFTNWSTGANIQGLGGGTTTNECYYKKMGKQVTLYFSFNGTGSGTGATAFNMTLPYSPNASVGVNLQVPIRTLSNTTYGTGNAVIAIGSTTMYFYPDAVHNAWTDGQARGAWGSITYETNT